MLEQARRFGYMLAHWNDPPREIIPLAKMPPVDVNDIEAYHVTPVSVHETLAEAKEALKQARAREPRQAFTSGLSLGLSIVAVLGLGLVLVYILFRRKSDNPTQTILQAPPQIIQLRDSRPPARVIDVKDEPDLPEYLGDEDPIIQKTDANPIENIATAVISALKREHQKVRTFMQSYTLPYIGDPASQAIRVATAGDAPYEVIVRVVEPPGSHGVFAFDPVELNLSGGVPFVQTVGTAYSEFPVGNVMPVPAGQFQIIRLRPRQALYAKGTSAPGGANQSTGSGGTVVAVTASDFVSGISW